MWETYATSGAERLKVKEEVWVGLSIRYFRVEQSVKINENVCIQMKKLNTVIIREQQVSRRMTSTYPYKVLNSVSPYELFEHGQRFCYKEIC